jgi:hypothetical protein
MIKQNYKIPLLWKSAGLIIYPSIFFFAFSWQNYCFIIELCFNYYEIAKSNASEI